MKGQFNKYYSRPVVTAVELFSAGWCNLACKYCYIPKTDFLKGIHKTIIERIKDGSFINDIKEIYGKDLEVISHWGTEPTLTVTQFKKFYEEAYEEFPKLRKVKISSNFMTNPDNLVKFVTEILPDDKKQLEIDIQVSLDGPAYITDKNRIGGSTQKIMDNCVHFTKEVNKIGCKHDISMHLKPTSGDDDILSLSQFDKTLEYYEFFDDFMTRWFESNDKGQINNISRACDPTLVLPGSYTSDDGKAFYQLVLNQIELQKRDWKSIQKPDSNYYGRYKQKLPHYKEIFTKQRMFTCSAGDSCFALGDVPGTSHICHQSFYMDHPDYYKEVERYGLDEQTMEGIECGRIENVKNGFITSKEDEMKTMKLMYLTRAYNDFLELKLSTTIAEVLELAHVGQINPIYKNVRMAREFAYFAQVVDCPMDNTTITGSQMVSCLSLLRVFGNGAFENIFKRTIKECN